MKFREHKKLFSAAILLGLILMLLAGTHIVVRWKLNHWKARMATQGERFEIQDYTPPYPPPAFPPVEEAVGRKMVGKI